MCTCVLNITVSLRARFLPPQHLVAKESSCFRRRSRGLVHLRVRLVCPAAQGGFLLRPARTLVAPSVAPLTVYLSRQTRRPRFVPEIRRVVFSCEFCSAGGDGQASRCAQNDANARVRWNLRDDRLRISARTAAGGHATGAASVSLTPTNAPSCACFQDDRCCGDAEFGRAP